jgi:hypothetical protein
MSLMACGNEQSYDPDYIDLTVMSGTMVYSEVLNMMNSPEEYTGKTVKMRGAFSYAEGTDRNYYACIIADATACCAQGIEFELAEERVFPDEYPEVGEQITVEGIFGTYYEDEYRYCTLTDAVMLK